ncbi:MAG: Gfo/Idh/MocA family oxidoreductase, partial [Verrucomicrobiota bacterium]
CGGRGTGAVSQIFNTGEGVELVAMADAFMDKVKGRADGFKNNKRYKDKMKVTDDTMFAGFDAYKKAIDAGPDVVVLATPPGFRPMHLEYAVSKGKHVFMEKPVAVDAPGVRSVLESARKAKEQNTLIQVGLQRRHEEKYQKVIASLQDGAIGEINYMRAWWNGGGVWVRDRRGLEAKKGAPLTEMEYQMRNWYYFNWLCGDHITEQHIHNLDVINWLKNDYPIEANGQGGRQVRNGIDHGEIYDHHFVEYTYADGSKMYSQCRHIKGCMNGVFETAHGSKGYCRIGQGEFYDAKGEPLNRIQGRGGGHQQEQTNMIDNLRKGNIVNEGEYGAKSSMTSVLGRMATYSGKNIKWKDAINSKIDLMPKDLSWDANPPAMPDENGRYPIPMPGKTKAY